MTFISTIEDWKAQCDPFTVQARERYKRHQKECFEPFWQALWLLQFIASLSIFFMGKVGIL